MPIVFAAVLPHSPLLVRGIAKDHHILSKVTRQAIDVISKELHARQIDTLIILTPHGHQPAQMIVANVHDRLVGRLRDFGDPVTFISVPGAVGWSHRLKEAAEDTDIPFQLQTYEELDYGTTIPLSFLHPPYPRILPIHVSSQPRNLLIRFGQTLHRFSQSCNERIGIIASGDCFRRSRVDKQTRPLPSERTIAHVISSIDLPEATTLAEDRTTCLIPPLVTLTATLAPLHARGTIQAFEVVTRIGLLTAVYNVGA